MTSVVGKKVLLYFSAPSGAAEITPEGSIVPGGTFSGIIAFRNPTAKAVGYYRAPLTGFKQTLQVFANEVLT